MSKMYHRSKVEFPPLVRVAVPSVNEVPCSTSSSSPSI